MMMTEEWRPITGYEGMYEVSNLGRVRSIPGYRRRGCIRKPNLKRNGYLFVALWKENRSENYYVHRLVATAFCSHRPDSEVVRHLDGDPLNNIYSNLSWGTFSENSYDAVRHGRNWLANKTHCKNGHEMTPENLYLRPNGRRRCKPCNHEENKRVRAKKKRNAAYAIDDGKGSAPVPPWPRPYDA